MEKNSKEFKRLQENSRDYKVNSKYFQEIQKNTKNLKNSKNLQNFNKFRKMQKNLTDFY